MATRLPNGKYRVYIRLKGMPRTQGIFDTEDEAKAFEAATHADAAHARALWTSEMTFEQARDAYLASTLFSQKTPHTQATERTRLRPVVNALGKYSLANLENGQRLAAYRDRRAREVSPRTKKLISSDAVRLELAAAAAVFAWAVENKVLPRNPAAGIKRPRGTKRNRRMWEHEQLNVFGVLFAKSMPEDLKEAARFVALQREVGCRPGELSCVLRDDVDIDSRAMRFRSTKYKREDRTIPLVPAAVEFVADQLVYGSATAGDSPFLFTSLSRSGRMPIPFHYQTAVGRLREAGIVDADFHAHAGRREFVSSAFENGLSHADIMQVTGHHSYAAVDIYNESSNLHPEVRKRFTAEAAVRKRAQLRAILEFYGAPEDAIEEAVDACERHAAAQPERRADGDAPTSPASRRRRQGQDRQAGENRKSSPRKQKAKQRQKQKQRHK